MKHDPYFLPLIQDAILSDNPKVALLDALREISRLGKQPEHAEEYAQFQNFMDRVAGQYDESKAKLEAERLQSCLGGRGARRVSGEDRLRTLVEHEAHRDVELEQHAEGRGERRLAGRHRLG